MDGFKFYWVKKHLSLLLVLLAVLPALAVGWLGHSFMFDYLRDDRMNDVGEVAEFKHNQLVMVFARENSRAALFLTSLSAQCGGNGATLNQSCAAKLTRAYGTAEGALGATLRSKGGVVFSSGPAVMRNEDDWTFSPGQLAKLTGTGPERNQSYFVTATEPATGLQLAVTYPAANLQPIFDRSSQLGASGEAFLADAAGYFVTKARYPSAQVHSHPITARPMQACLAGKTEAVVDVDYRGAEIIHGFRFVPEIGSGCIMAHIDPAEEFAPLAAEDRKSTAISLIFLLPVTLAALYLARRIKKSDGSLHASENKFRALFEGANDGLMLLDMQGRILDINRTGQQRLGWSMAEMLGRSVADFVPPGYAARVPARLSEIHAKGQVSFESAHQRRDGTLMPIEVNARLVELDGRQIYYSAVRDITERKQMEGELSVREARYRGAIETSPDGFWMTDMQGSLLEVNDAYVRASGYSRAELLSMAITDLEVIEKPEETAAHIHNIMQHGYDRFETLHRTKDGRIWPVEIVVTHGAMEGGRLFVFCRDLTERRQAEARLQKYMLELERSNRDLDEFAYIASHDLKEPLRGIHNYASFLQEDFSDKLDDTGRNYLERMQRLAERQTDLINSLLAFSRVGNTELTVEWTDLERILDNVAEDLKPYLATQQVELRRAGRMPSVLCNPVRAGEVFQNLIVNGAKYSDKATKWVEVGCDASGHTPVFYVRDNGIGIPAQHQEAVFRMFKRLHEQSKYGGGTGAGLSIVKKIVERHGGRIWLESVPGEGTTLYFTLGEGAQHA